jgi:hypothetical protein
MLPRMPLPLAVVLPALQPERPRFLGTGAFGGPWAASSD